MTDKLKKETCQATHEEVCDEALAHYEEISIEATHWNSLVPRAIEFYKKWGNKDLDQTINRTREETLKEAIEIAKQPTMWFGTENSKEPPLKEQLYEQKAQIITNLERAIGEKI